MSFLSGDAKKIRRLRKKKKNSNTFEGAIVSFQSHLGLQLARVTSREIGVSDGGWLVVCVFTAGLGRCTSAEVSVCVLLFWKNGAAPVVCHRKWTEVSIGSTRLLWVREQ